MFRKKELNRLEKSEKAAAILGNGLRPYASLLFDLWRVASHAKSHYTSSFRSIEPIRDQCDKVELVTAEGDTDLLDILRIAGGLVTDQGGITCHLGTIARDLGIPAVLGTAHATKWIETGDTVYIDASEGTVQKLPPLFPRKRSFQD